MSFSKRFCALIENQLIVHGIELHYAASGLNRAVGIDFEIVLVLYAISNEPEKLLFQTYSDTNQKILRFLAMIIKLKLQEI